MSDKQFAEWRGFNIAMVKFEDFLKKAVVAGGALKDWHVVFALGTVARFDLAAETEFTGYDGEYSEGFPEHRVGNPDTIQEIIQHNIQNWERQKTTGGDVGKALRVGYRIMLKDGYPYPGGEGSDRLPIPMGDPREDHDDFLWTILWSARNHQVTSLALARDMMTAIANGGEQRRLDFMFPLVKAVIAPDLTITRLD